MDEPVIKVRTILSVIAGLLAIIDYILLVILLGLVIGKLWVLVIIIPLALVSAWFWLYLNPWKED